MQIFDGHNDVLSRLWCGSTDPVADFDRDIGHINMPAARAGNLVGGFFALYAPSERAPYDFSALTSGAPELPLAPMLDEAQAAQAVFGQLGIAMQLSAAGQIEICTSAAALEQAIAGPALAAVLHLEGAECIGPDLLALEALHGFGLRSLGPVWSRPTIFGDGVPFKSGVDGDTGAGLTDAGQRLLRRCAELGIMIDTSHMTLKGFWQVAEAGLPLVATHSNAYALGRNARNLTDDQLRGIAQTGGMVGLNFATVFLSDRGWQSGQADLSDCIRQLDHLIAVAGEDHVGLGSDFDGAPLPQGITSAADLGALVAAMGDHGYDAALIDKITSGNWRRLLAAHLG